MGWPFQYFHQKKVFPKNQTLHILLPVHNRIEKTKIFINCLLKQNYNKYKLILIDDGSSDGTSEYVKKKIPNAMIIKGNGKWWWAGSLQQGYLWIKNNVKNENDLILIINDDVTFNKRYLSIGTTILNETEKSVVYSNVFSMQNRQLFWSGIHIDWEKYRFNTSQMDRNVNCVSTRGIFITVKDFIKIGHFHPILLPHYNSDYEFTYRAFKKGFKFESSEKLLLMVDESTSGYRDFNKDRIKGFYQKLFSKRNPSNPVYSAMFIILACPLKYKLINIIRIIKQTSVSIYSNLRYNFIWSH